MEKEDYKRIIEAALFMSPRAMTVQEIATAAGIATPGTIQIMLAELITDYRTRGTALDIIEVNRKYMLTIKEPYATKVGGLASKSDLSRGAMRILAYVN